MFTDVVLRVGILFFFVGFLCLCFGLCFCIPAFDSALVSYIEAAASRVYNKSDCKRLSERASFSVSVRELAAIISAMNSTCLRFCF